jgi:peptidoglycan hydrolase CwlO-like protein
MINIPIPSLHKIEKMIRRGSSIKDGLNSLIQPDSDEILKLMKKIEEQDEAIYAKKQEIAVLKSEIELLQETIGGYQS